VIPAVMQGFGGQLYLIKGGQIDIVCKSLTTEGDSETTSLGQANNSNTAALTNFHKRLFGGENSWFPGAYCNHKPVAFLGRDRMIQTLNLIDDTKRVLYVVGFDGSGLFNNKGAEFETEPWRAGRGCELLSPSGVPLHYSYDHALLRHNDHVFMCGVHVRGVASSPWNTDMGWDVGDNSEITSLEGQRTYRMLSIKRDTDKRIMGPAKNFTPDAVSKHDLHACDMIGFRDDLYFANYVDIVRWPGASGTPEIMSDSLATPRAKVFSTWPSGGLTSAGAPVGENRFLVLDSDTCLYRMKAPASGRNLIIDLSSVRANENGRGTSNLARASSTTTEPARPPSMFTFNNELNVFLITQTSGYMHFTCNGDPSGVTNWTDRTDQMPEDMRRVDGCTYSFVDSVRQKTYAMHVSYAPYGIFGHAGGGQSCGGGMWLFELSTDRTWKEIWSGNIGLPPRGLVPYRNFGPYAVVPSGNNPELFKCNDYAVLEYELFDHFGRTVDVDVDFSLDAGGTWNTARRFRSYDTGVLLGSGVEGLIAPNNGETYTFFWDVVNDVGFNVEAETLLRVRPRLSQ